MGAVVQFPTMDRFGKMPTEAEYISRVVSMSAPIYDIGVYSDGTWYPYECDSDGAPIDGLPYAPFKTEAQAIECVKRLGGVLAHDYFAIKYSHDQSDESFERMASYHLR